MTARALVVVVVAAAAEIDNGDHMGLEEVVCCLG
jgi:hypothetical protein